MQTEDQASTEQNRGGIACCVLALAMISSGKADVVILMWIKAAILGSGGGGQGVKLCTKFFKEWRGMKFVGIATWQAQT